MSSFTSKLLNGFAWRLCLYVSSFILNIFIAKSLQADQAGVFYLLLNNIAFVVLLLSFGLDSAVAYFGSRKEIKSGNLLVLSIGCSLFACILMIAFYYAVTGLRVFPAHPLAPYIL